MPTPTFNTPTPAPPKAATPAPSCTCPIEDWRDVPDGSTCLVCGKPFGWVGRGGEAQPAAPPAAPLAPRAWYGECRKPVMRWRGGFPLSMLCVPSSHPPTILP